MVAPIYDLLKIAVPQWFPGSNTAIGVAAAVAVIHLVVRDVRRLRRGLLHPIRFVGRFLRGLATYAVLIGAAWVAVTISLHHL